MNAHFGPDEGPNWDTGAMDEQGNGNVDSGDTSND